jgi:hypothetical protein
MATLAIERLRRIANCAYSGLGLWYGKLIMECILETKAATILAGGKGTSFAWNKTSQSAQPQK